MLKIGITSQITIEQNDIYGPIPTESVNQVYIDAILASGGVPLILPSLINDEGIADQVASIDGLLLTGGYDISPRFYNEEPSPSLGRINPRQDRHQLKLFKEALKQEKPVFGICRGMQLINVAMGGTLYQDISMQSAKVLQHQQLDKRTHPIHSVKVHQDSLLYQELQKPILEVNSIHHQSIHRLAEGLTISAVAKDGTIEGVEWAEKGIFAVQWHPEEMFREEPLMKKIFDCFMAMVDASQDKKITKM